MEKRIKIKRNHKILTMHGMRYKYSQNMKEKQREYGAQFRSFIARFTVNVSSLFIFHLLLCFSSFICIPYTVYRIKRIMQYIYISRYIIGYCCARLKIPQIV